MFKLIALIKITDPHAARYIELPFVTAIEIDKSRTTLTNTAKVTLPRRIKLIQGDINDFFKRGSKVEISLGYDNNLVKEFVGYITEINAQTPLEIKCQDQMWKLKQNSFTKAFKDADAREIVSHIYQGPQKVVDQKIGNLKLQRHSTAQALELLKNKAGLQAYFDNDGVLVVDKIAALHYRKDVWYDFSENVLENNLSFKRKEEVKIKVLATSNLASGNKLEVTVGDADGEVHSLNYYNQNLKALEQQAKNELDYLKYDGYRGDFKALGYPYVQPGDIATLIDPDYPERKGAYLIQTVKISFGTAGFRRIVSPERKLA